MPENEKVQELHTDIDGNVIAPAFIYCNTSVTGNCLYGDAVLKNTFAEKLSISETVHVDGIGYFIQDISVKSNVISNVIFIGHEGISSTGNVVCANFIGNASLLTDLSYPGVVSTLQKLRDRITALESKWSQ